MEAEILKQVLIWVVTTLLGALVTYFIMKYKSVSKENKALKEGMQCLLRNDIIKQHEKSEDRGYCPIYVKEALTKSYTAYHELGGNGLVTKLYNDVMALPESKHEIKNMED